ncbi:MAG TPA: helix-turn-helix domain-containing protein [Herpetosiphonaceae bacterium]|nr:helix-turn-helix domain-containing protein [Herpetosiphonaceae bacterium]
MSDDELLTVTQAAAYLGMTRQAVHLLTKRPVPGLGRRVGSVWLFTRSELDSYQERPRTHGGRPRGSKTSAGVMSPISLG